ncbi:MAG: bifunctional ornithine acetyltransferase/N-acetylglutamate synthase [Candidatus Omnitrophica bacterium CG1_02_40_15]|nr:MAG: bifunctional ornithine acetyltransferase/N-acetylglutamate synthase [Candidatus Omnitrophica bacterium CG1_02_40_15]
MKLINGGVTAPKGFLAGSMSCGIKKSGKSDLALLFSSTPCVAAGTFTTNKVRSGSVVLSRERLKKGFAQAVIVNSGNANCCVGKKEIKDAKEITKALSAELDIKKDLMLIASTGIIGRPLPAQKIKNGLKALVNNLSNSNGTSFAKAIMTTDTVHKEIAVEINIKGKVVRVAGAVKGAGMICPNMATMLAFFTTDAAIETKALKQAFKESVHDSFNKITIDGDMSTNDSAIIFANGQAGNSIIKNNTKDYFVFFEAVKFVTRELSRKIVLDGEGATRFIEIIVKGAKAEDDAGLVAKRIANSNLVKTMIAGGDPNWGRIAAASGSSEADINPERMDIYFGKVLVMKNGAGVNASRGLLLDIFRKKEIKIIVDLKSGKHADRIWTCDFTEEYVKINAEYET